MSLYQYLLVLSENELMIRRTTKNCTPIVNMVNYWRAVFLAVKIGSVVTEPV